MTMREPLYHLVVGPDGEITCEAVPDEARDEVIDAMAAVAAAPVFDDDDCPICRALRHAGLSDAGLDGTGADPAPVGPNRSERRALAATLRRSHRRRPLQ
jgi:hypothetical protein